MIRRQCTSMQCRNHMEVKVIESQVRGTVVVLLEKIRHLFVAAWQGPGAWATHAPWLRQSGCDWVGTRQRRNEIMWRAARPAGGRLYVRGTRLPNRTERHAGGVQQPCRTPRQSCWAPGPVVGVAPVAGCVRARRRARPPPAGTAEAGRVASRPARSVYFCYLFACRCGGIYRFRALAGPGDRDVVCVPQYTYVAPCRAPIIVVSSHARFSRVGRH
jgi:hypothetical protein